MLKIINQAAPILGPVSRRAMLAGGGALIVAVTLPVDAGRAQGRPDPRNPPPISPNAFIRIGSDSIVTVMVKHIEMGQGPNTGLATLVAEELDADWSQMRAESAPGNTKLYANLAMGMQLTGGSSAIANSFIQMRRAGAMARALLVEAAARQWSVPASQVTVKNGVIAHPSGRSARFGEFADAASKLPMPAEVKLKDPADFSLIGKASGVGRPDSRAKSNGTALFGMDIQEPGMLVAMVARAPRFGAKLSGFDPAPAMAVPGVVAVKQIGTGVAVFAKNNWAAIKGREAVRSDWELAGAEARGSDELVARFRAMAAETGAIAKQAGDANAAFAAAAPGDILEREYIFPYLAHAPMEPLNGYIEWDGTQVKARYGSQAPTLDQGAMARVLGISPAAVAIDVTYAGGSFGRRAQTDSHFAVELAEVAKAIGPGAKVKLVWSREDDIRGGYYRPMMLHRMKAVVTDGDIVAWRNTVAGQSFFFGSPLAAMMPPSKVDTLMVEGSDEPPYALPNFECSVHVEKIGIPTLWWRSVGHTHTGYAVECFIDEALVKAGKDPVQGRLDLMKDQPRLAGTLRAVAAAAKWKGSKVAKGRARGVACVESFNTFVAQIAEISMGEDGLPIVHKVWCAVDCGVAVNPDVIRAQMEGGIGFALGHALFGDVPIKDGAPTIFNFDEYKSLRINRMPEVEVVIVASAQPPSGVGEPGVPPTAPAIANAMAALGLDRPAHLPIARNA